MSSTGTFAYPFVSLVLHFCFSCLLLFVFLSFLAEILFRVKRFAFAYNRMLELRLVDLLSPPAWISKLVGSTREAAGCSFRNFS
jgi:hypothetical protein